KQLRPLLGNLGSVQSRRVGAPLRVVRPCSSRGSMVLRAGRSAGRDRRAPEHLALDLPDLRPDSQRVWLAAAATDPRAGPIVPARRILVVTTATAPQAELQSIVRAHAGDDAEVQVVAPASKISWLDRLTN